MRYLVTGGLGLIGCNVSARLLEMGEEVTVLDNLSRRGASANLAHLQSLSGSLTFVHADVRNRNDVEGVFRSHPPDRVFHLAGQVAMTTSVANPRLDFEVNAQGTLNVLEAARASAPGGHVIFASTNKVYGDLRRFRVEEAGRRYILPDCPYGIAEDAPLAFHSPYGCSKGAADQYVLDYHRVYGLRTTVFRHSTVYGERQFATFDQGWIGWFCRQAILQKQGGTEPFTVSGNGMQVRDVLHVDDCVACYLAASSAPDVTAGRVYNIGGGPEHSLSILELFDFLQSELGVALRFVTIPWRNSDQRVFVSDIRRAQSDFRWAPRVPLHSALRRMLAWAQEQPAGA